MRNASPALLVMGVLLAAASTASGCSCGDPEVVQNNGGATASGGAGGISAGGAGGDVLTSSGGSVSTGGAGVGGGTGGVNEECLFIPDPGDFAPELDCAWSDPAPGSPYPAANDVVSTPVVVNLTDDNGDGMVDTNDIPDIAFIAYQLSGGCPAGMTCGCCNSSGVLRVVSGACELDGTMTEHFTVGATEIAAQGFPAGIWLDNSGGLAAGDIDADGSVDLVATTRNGGTIAFERDGTVKWHQPDYPVGVDHLAGTTPSIADLDADGLPEILQGRVVLNGEDGSLAWAGTAGLGTNGFLGPVTAAGDVDLDGFLNLLAGNTLYDEAGNALWSYTFPVPITSANCQASGKPCDGFTATGNFDADDEGEIVIVRAGTIYILNHDGTPMQVGGADVRIDIPIINCGKNEGGPPTVADFDGDGEAEIAAAGADYYIVADLECLASPLPAQCSDPGIRWKLPNDDCSSRVTGSSVFDFDGDGKAEVVYNDEQLFRVLDGTTGAVLVSLPNTSHTRLEMPIVADVDNDGNAEILFIENASGGSTQGIRVWADATDSWVPTRRIWNQHAYHVTNVDELGQIPVNETPNWLAPTEATPSKLMNNFRQNLPDFSVFAAPDLSVTLSFDKSTCPAALGVAATVCNQGLLQVGAGVEVKFYDNGTMSEIGCTNAPVLTQNPLGPGQCELVTCLVSPPPMEPASIDVRACVDNAGYACDAVRGMGGNNECIEDNNLNDAIGTGCPDGPA